MVGKYVVQVNNIVITKVYNSVQLPLGNGNFLTFRPNEFVAWGAGKDFLVKSFNYIDVYNLCAKNYKYLARKPQKVKDENDLIRKKVIEESQYNKELVFHGSKGGIKGEISCNINSDFADFGKGFYIGESLLQAENRVCEEERAKVYAFNIDLTDANVYRFTDKTLWALFVAYNRRKNIPFNKYPNVVKKIKEILAYDVIIGLIADDKISMVYDEFLDGYITDRVLVECLKFVEYGNQIVIKNDAVAKRILSERYAYDLNENMKYYSSAWGKSLKYNLNANLAEIQRKYRRDGKFLDECLEVYNHE